jgi:hypothetical protein
MPTKRCRNWRLTVGNRVLACLAIVCAVASVPPAVFALSSGGGCVTTLLRQEDHGTYLYTSTVGAIGVGVVTEGGAAYVFVHPSECGPGGALELKAYGLPYAQLRLL